MTTSEQARADAMADAETFAAFAAVYGDENTRGLSSFWFRKLTGWHGTTAQYWWSAGAVNAVRAALRAVPGLRS